MKKIIKFLFYWLPPFVWIGFIFYLSSRSGIFITKEFFWDFIIFKTFHMIEYAILNFLFFRAFYGLRNKSTDLNKIMIYSFILAIVYASADEYHQTFVPSREGKLRDVIIDSVGAGLMYIYIKSTFRFWKRFL